MNLIYFDLYQSTQLEKFVTACGVFLKASGQTLVTWKRASTMDEVLQEVDIEAILKNCSRRSVIDEAALVEYLKEKPMFQVGFDVFEDEPYMKPGFVELKNAIVVPHIAFASKWAREGMVILETLNVLVHFSHAGLISMGKIKG